MPDHTNTADRTKSSLPNPRLLATYDRTKDISYHPYFRGGISRWLWRFFMYRVTSPGRWFMGLTFFLTLYGATSLDLQIFVPLLYAMGIWAVAWSIAMIFPPRARLICSVPSRVAAGAEVPVTLDIVCRSRWPLVEVAIVPMRLSPYVDCVPADGVKLKELLPGQELHAQLSLVFRKRGLYTVRGLRIETAFPLGILRAYTCLWQSSRVLAYPTFQSLSTIELPSIGRYQPGGVVLASKVGDALEYVGNREYRDGDNVRDIDWRATARITKPIVREYREEYFYRVGVIQDTHVQKGKLSFEEDFERSVSVSAAVSDYMARQEYIVDLFAAGPNLYHLTSGRNLAVQDQILDILACLEPATSPPFQIVEPELLEHLARLTTVICILLDWDSVRRDFVDRIRQVSAVKVIVVRDAACTLAPEGVAADLGLRVITRADFESGVSLL